MKKIILLAFVVGLVGCGKSEAEKAKAKAEMTEIKVNRLGRERVQQFLKDADSAKFRNEVAYCGEVNAKNGFGAFTGFKKYIAASEQIVIMDGDIPAAQFNELWQKHGVSYAK